MLGMKLRDILQSVDAYKERTGESDAAISRRLGKSSSLIRNWRKRVDAGDSDASASADTIGKLDALVGGLGLTDRQPKIVKGFGEAALAPWIPKTTDKDLLLKMLAPDAQHPSAFLLSDSIPELFYRAGDVLVIDLRRPPESGETVIANRVDLDTGTAVTLIGRLLPPYIAPPSANMAPVLIDSTISVMGPVISSFRNPEAQPVAR